MINPKSTLVLAAEAIYELRDTLLDRTSDKASEIISDYFAEQPEPIEEFLLSVYIYSIEAEKHIAKDFTLPLSDDTIKNLRKVFEKFNQCSLHLLVINFVAASDRNRTYNEELVLLEEDSLLRNPSQELFELLENIK